MRVMLECGVGYESDLEHVEQLTKQTIANVFSQVKEANEVEFYYTEFGGSSINFSIRYWIDYPDQPGFLKAQSEGIMAIKKGFDENDISIPFPIRTLDINPEQFHNAFNEVNHRID